MPIPVLKWRFRKLPGPQAVGSPEQIRLPFVRMAYRTPGTAPAPDARQRRDRSQASRSHGTLLRRAGHSRRSVGVAGDGSFIFAGVVPRLSGSLHLNVTATSVVIQYEWI